MQAHMTIHGRVQGVGFRKSAKNHAQKQNLTGWVQNKQDGTVELKVEGAKDSINSYISMLKDGFNPYIKVEKVEMNQSGNEEGFDDFTIKR
ncbi:acylphosphatase [Virgibacillus kekensis]|uniref:Acylphosphatase n=1 Tax=Virgibacillus kekensis TaxID=202261 RepID=A0ABV9DFZ6_9BACI